MAENEAAPVELKVDRQNLYKEESFTDLKVCTIRRLSPIKPDGSADKTRKTLFFGSTNIITPKGPLPIQSMIQARELQQAVKNFPETMKSAMERLLEEVEKQKQQQESRIIVPGR
jgi:hypothetical protein